MGRFFGVPIHLSPSWLLIAFVIMLGYSDIVRQEVPDISSTGAYLVALVFAVLLALSVLAHELGHTAVSLALGMPVRRVVIFLLGGVSEISGEPKRPSHEYLVAIAGPLVSLVIAGISALLYPLAHPDSAIRLLLVLLVWSNLLVMVFNMLPGLPLDGGRVLRAGVWKTSGDQIKATRVAAITGRGVAVLVLVGSLATAWTENGLYLSNALIGGLLALFIWVGASQSLAAAALASRLPKLRVADLARSALEIPGDVSVAEALRRAEESSSDAVVVIDSRGQPSALVSFDKANEIPERQRPWTNVTAVSRALEPGLTLPDSLEGNDVLDALRRTPATEYLIVGRNSETIGVLAARDVAALLTGRDKTRQPIVGAQT